MTVLLDQRYERTLDTMLNEEAGTSSLQLWTFDDLAHRRRAEARFARIGVSARCRSAYKPLLHFFLEEVDRQSIARAKIAYPVCDEAPANRFRLEAYPLAGLMAGAEISFEPKREPSLAYEVTLDFRNGARQSHSVLVPNRLHADLHGRLALSPTGWIVRDGEGPGQRIETDYERLFHAILDAAGTADWPVEEPYFPEMLIRVAFPARDEPLNFGQEVVSLREALHEDLCFSLLDLFHRRSGRAPGDRQLQPGRIVPVVAQSVDRVTARVEVRPITRFATGRRDQSKPTPHRAPGLARLNVELDRVGGRRFEARSVGGRRIVGRYVAGSEAPVMISGGQHANEITGVLGALFGAIALARRPNAHFSVCPLENPDGYALHQHLCRSDPNHIHHAARYTALGDDLEYRHASVWEKRIRTEAERLTRAKLHINAHGYPSHEWTRPLTHYIPRGAEMWTLPKGFCFLVLHHEGWGDLAMKMLQIVTHKLHSVSGLVEFNARQIDLFKRHAGDFTSLMVNGFVCLCRPDERSAVPVTLVTEYPDETIDGDALIAGRNAQMAAVVAAYEAWQECACGPLLPQDRP
ncbi:peptidase M14 [Labrys neptuniae]